jgi:hypothetical protein
MDDCQRSKQESLKRLDALQNKEQKGNWGCGGGSCKKEEKVGGELRNKLRNRR